MDGGAVVEVLANTQDVQGPAAYIQGMQKKMGPIASTEWDHVKGSTLLSVTGTLSPSLDAKYTAAFGK